MRWSCLSAASQGFSAAAFEMPCWNSAGVGIKFTWQMSLTPETGHAASACSVCLPDALAWAAVPAVPMAVLWSSCATSWLLAQPNRTWMELSSVLLRLRHLSSGHKTCTEADTRSFHHISCATFHFLQPHPKHQAALCCGWHSEYRTAERQRLQSRHVLLSSVAQKRLTIQARRSEVESEEI